MSLGRFLACLDRLLGRSSTRRPPLRRERERGRERKAFALQRRLQGLQDAQRCCALKYPKIGRIPRFSPVGRRSLATRNHARAPWHVARLVYVTIRRAVLGSATMAHPPVRDRRARPSRAPPFPLLLHVGGHFLPWFCYLPRRLDTVSRSCLARMPSPAKVSCK